MQVRKQLRAANAKSRRLPRLLIKLQNGKWKTENGEWKCEGQVPEKPNYSCIVAATFVHEAAAAAADAARASDSSPSSCASPCPSPILDPRQLMRAAREL